MPLLVVIISIHALREEGDASAWTRRARLSYFYPRPPRGGRPRGFRTTLSLCVISIHALREEGDYCLLIADGLVLHFYPRPPRGGRPSSSVLLLRISSNFYPRPPRGGRQYLYRSYHTLGGFLSTPSARRATPRRGSACMLPTFLSTPSARRATPPCSRCGLLIDISIHALREEGDPPAAAPVSSMSDFYPRPPRGGRLFLDTPDDIQR